MVLAISAELSICRESDQPTVHFAFSVCVVYIGSYFSVAHGLVHMRRLPRNFQ